jgi:hypothetical protein
MLLLVTDEVLLKLRSDAISWLEDRIDVLCKQSHQHPEYHRHVVRRRCPRVLDQAKILCSGEFFSSRLNECTLTLPVSAALRRSSQGPYHRSKLHVHALVVVFLAHTISSLVEKSTIESSSYRYASGKDAIVVRIPYSDRTVLI